MKYHHIFSVAILSLFIGAIIPIGVSAHVEMVRPALFMRGHARVASTSFNARERFERREQEMQNDGIASTSFRPREHFQERAREVHNKFLERAQSRIDREITRRVRMLNMFMSRVENIRIPDKDKSALKAVMQEQIKNLTVLKENAMSRVSTTTLKTTIRSIAKSYRTFALVVPKGAITAAADRVNQIASQAHELSKKLEERIKSATGDTSALTSTLADFNEKVSDATSLAQKAVSEVNSLSLGSGDQTVFRTNRVTLRDAHKKLQLAQRDLFEARKDAGEIIRGLVAMGKNAPVNSSAHATSSTTVTE